MIELSKAIIQKDGKYLLLKRASHSIHYPGLWDFAGGKLDPGETPKQAAIREIKEETNFDIEVDEELKQIEFKDVEHDLLFHYFIPTSIKGDLKLSSDHSEFKWVEGIEGLEVHPSVKLFLQ
jgi:mutator protein MutT